ncbi:MAG TPA: glycosyltransferase family 4 protein [Fimbriimonas sp.]
MPERELKVLLLNEFFYPDNQGGTATATSNIASRLHHRHQARVTAITGRFAYRDPNIRYPAKEQWDGIEIHRVPSPNWSRERTLKRFAGNLLFAHSVAWRALTLPRPDVTLVTTAPLTLPIAAGMLKLLRGVPYVYLVYDLDPDRTVALKVMEPSSKAVRWMRRYQAAWLHGASSVIAIGRCMKDRLVRDYRLPPEKVAVVEVGADPDVVRPLPKATSFRQRHGIEGFVVLYSGNFGQYHDFETILGAAERLQEEAPDVTLVLVGGGHKKKEVEQAVALRGLRNVRIFPFVPEEELADLLASGDMNLVTLEPGMEGLCVPSKFYTCLASGRPTLALMAGEVEVSRVIDEADCGARVEIGDVEGMVREILQARDDPARLDEQGCRARAVFERLYTIDKVVEKLYATLAKGAGR